MNQKFLNYFYEQFESKYFGVEVCIATAKKVGILVPSVKTVYNWINFNVIKISAKKLLRPKKFHQKKWNSRRFKGFLQENVISIAYRPSKINKRKETGHYEIDLINSSKESKSSLLTLVDRKTRFGYAIKVNTKHMNHINDKLLELINKNNINIKSLTKDNGVEFNSLTNLTKKINIKLYNCHPYAAWEKATNENFNGLIRRTFPKGTNFDKIDENQLQEIIDKINKMPRKIFSYLSSKNLYEAFI